MIRPTKTITGGKALQAIQKGVNAIYDVVKVTFGPQGKSALLYRTMNRGNRMTDDGVTVAECQEPKDQFVRMAAQTFKEACKRTVEKVGDGPQPLYSKVLTPQGWKKMGDIVIGDKICGTNGTIQEVEGVFEKGEKEIYEVEFSDGRVVECCKDHLWNIKTNYGIEKVMTVQQILDSGRLLTFKKSNNSRNYGFYTPQTVVEFEDKKLPLDAYFLGTLLGDGSLSGSGDIELSLGLNKEHVLAKLVLPEGVTFESKWVEEKNYFRVKFKGDNLVEILKDLNLYGTKSKTKFIPESYLYSGHEDRCDLLSGLLDTDGHINTRGLFEYSTVSDKLSSDFQELVRGLGYSTNYILHTRENESSYSDTPIHRITQLVGYKYGNKIVEIRPTGKITEMRCIKVSNPDSLYITDNYIVTHNTTCTTIIGGALFNEIYLKLDEKQNAFSGTKKGVVSIKKEILAAAVQVKEEIKKAAKKVETLEDLEKIAIISVKDVELGKIIAKMAWEVGLDGFIDVVEGYKGEIETEIIKGMRFTAKVPIKAFVNNPARYEMTVQDCPILVTNHILDNVGSFAGAFTELQKGTSKLIVVAPSFSDNALVNFVNAFKSGYFIYPVLAPSLRTEQFEDLAVYCGATFIDKSKGKKLQNIRSEDLGFIEKIVVKDSETKEDAVITGGKGSIKTNTDEAIDSALAEKHKTEVEKRIETLKGQLAETKQESFKMLMQRRIASMASAVGVIKVGDSTQASSLYRKLKIEDAVFACKAALKGGYVPGGGLCLKTIADQLPDDNILKTTLLAPYEQIQSSVDGGIEIGEDVIDPADAIYYAVEHATQVVAELITVDSITCEIEDPMPGDGEFAIARALNEFVLSDKINKGQVKEGEAEAYRDNLGGMTEDEYSVIHRD
jgi:chaperonin GroEL (HSP60 family)